MKCAKYLDDTEIRQNSIFDRWVICQIKKELDKLISLSDLVKGSN